MNKLILPGLIDIHVHLRDLGQENKEDYLTGTSAALAGGFTTVIDMPNNKVPITTLTTLKAKIAKAKDKIVCNLGFYFGSLGNNISEFAKVKDLVFGLKLYLNATTGNYLVDLQKAEIIMKNWSCQTPILLHAEDNIIDQLVRIAQKYRQKIHFCHVSTKYELECIIKAKKAGVNVTCGVTPHHLFLTDHDVKYLKGFGMMMPALKTKKDQEYLWKNINMIDCIESDHAPHTIEEKQSPNPPYGVPGLETTLPLLLTAVHEKRLTIKDIIEKCYDNPRKIFHIPTFKNTVEVDFNKQYTIENKNLKTKCQWSSFDGWKVRGQINKVYIKEQMVYEGGKVIARPGSGKILKPEIN